MYRVIRNFTLGNTAYEIGDTVADSDNQTIQADPHYRQFVVLFAVTPAPQFPAPNP